MTLNKNPSGTVWNLASEKENMKSNQLVFENRKKEQKYLRDLAIPDIK